jgi:uncharacterized protein (TIGR00255 family)
MRSMTGFGLGDAPVGGGKLSVEIRGVNHRFLDVRVRTSREVGDLAGFLEQLTRERLTRGRYEVAVRLDGSVLSAPTLDMDRARGAFHALRTLRDELAPGVDVPLALLGSVPELFSSSVDREIDRLRDAARIAFERAASALDAMRLQEGSSLLDDLQGRLRRIEGLCREVERRAPDVVEAHRKRLRERAERLLAATDLEADTPRLEQEIAMFAERSDICEEITRLESHSAQFSKLLSSDEPVGRRLDFLLQEMAREANTIGAKSPDAQISHAVIDIKAEIERMREQVQNVE